jgi:fatty acid desaturase
MSARVCLCAVARVHSSHGISIPLAERSRGARMRAGALASRQLLSRVSPRASRAYPGSAQRSRAHVSGIPYIVERVTTIARHACGKVDETFVSPACVSRVILEARLVIAFCAVLLGISWLLGSWAALVFWLIPLAFGQPMLRLFLLAEHTLCAQGAEVRYNTRTTCCHPLLRRLTWNMSFHLEHHLFPSIPFHALAAAHQRLAGSLPAPAPSYVSFHRSLIGTLK